MDRYTDQQIVAYMANTSETRNDRLRMVAYACLDEAFAIEFPEVANSMEHTIPTLADVDEVEDHEAIVANPDLADALDCYLDSQRGYILAEALHGTLMAWVSKHVQPI